MNTNQSLIQKHRESIIFQNSQASILEKCEICVKNNPNVKTRIFKTVGTKILHVYREHKGQQNETIALLSRLKSIATEYHMQTKSKRLN